MTYGALGRRQTALIFITNEIGIGVLSLPEALRTLGLIPSIVTTIGLGLLTTYAAYIYSQFYRHYPEVMNVIDCCRIVGGTTFGWVCVVVFELNLVLSCSATLATMAIALNRVSRHTTCTVWFIALPAVASWLLCIPRRFKFIAHLGSESFCFAPLCINH